MAFSKEIIKKVLQYLRFRVPQTEEKNSYYTEIGNSGWREIQTKEDYHAKNTFTRCHYIESPTATRTQASGLRASLTVMR